MSGSSMKLAIAAGIFGFLGAVALSSVPAAAALTNASAYEGAAPAGSVPDQAIEQWITRDVSAYWGGRSYGCSTDEGYGRRGSCNAGGY